MAYRIYYQKFGDGFYNEITEVTIATSLKRRTGFSKLGSGAEIGKATLTFRASLSACIAFGRDEKVILIEDRDTGKCIFHGYCDSASIEPTADSNVAYVKVDVYPFAKAFSQAIAPADIVYEDCEVCNPADTGHSLVHLMTQALYDNLPSKFRDRTSMRTSTQLVVSTDIPIVVIRKGDSIDEVLNKLLKEYGIARISETDPDTRGMVCRYVRPYDDQTPIDVPYKTIFSNPSIKTAPFTAKERLKVTLSIPTLTGTGELVYKMRDESDSISSDGDLKLKPNESYPKEDGQSLNVAYGIDTDDTRKFLYAVNPSVEVTILEKGGADTGAWQWEKKELSGTGADFKVRYIGQTEYAYLNNIKVRGERVYYTENSSVVEDVETDAPVSEYISEFLTNSADARFFIRTQNAERRGETNTFRFASNKVQFEPDTIVKLGDSDALILIRYVEDDLITGESVANGVLYQISDVDVTSSLIGKTALAKNRITVVQYAKGTTTEPTGAWQDSAPSIAEGEYLWERTGSFAPPMAEPSEWSVFRLTGLRGNDGKQGPEGGVGPAGPTGPQGEKGDTGATGPEGPQGPQGEQGKQGNDGARGSITIQWSAKSYPQATIDNFYIGYHTNGLSGNPGVEGKAGDIILQNITNSTTGQKMQFQWLVASDFTSTQEAKADLKTILSDGAKGDTGDKGDTGPQGETGAKGDKGDAGITYITVAENYDLNTATANSTVYWSTATSVCRSLVNRPTDAQGFICGEFQMRVDWAGSDGYIFQNLQCKAGSAVKSFRRVKSRSTWGAWAETSANGAAGKGISAETVQFKATSTNTAPTSGWTTYANSGYSAQNMYLWSKRWLTYTDGSTSDPTVSIAGVWGKDGVSGSKGGLWADAGTKNRLKLGVYNDSGAPVAGNYSFTYNGSTKTLAISSTVKDTGLSYSANGVGFLGMVGTAPQLLKIQTGDGTAKWTGYNDTTVVTPVCILGQFSNGSLELYATAKSPSDAQKSVLMQMMSEASTSEDFRNMANALGIDQIFDKLAVMEAFINRLMTNEMVLSSGGHIKSEDYAEHTDADGKTWADNGFMLDADGHMRACNGTFNKGQFVGGEFKNISVSDGSTLQGAFINDNFKTVDAGSTDGPFEFDAYQKWYSGQALYDKLTGAAANTIVSASGTFGGKTVNAMVRKSSGAKIALASQAAINAGETKTYTIVMAGPYQISKSSELNVYVNNTLVSSESSDYYTQTHTLKKGDTIKISSSSVNTTSGYSIYYTNTTNGLQLGFSDGTYRVITSGQWFWYDTTSFSFSAPNSLALTNLDNRQWGVQPASGALPPTNEYPIGRMFELDSEESFMGGKSLTYYQRTSETSLVVGLADGSSVTMNWSTDSRTRHASSVGCTLNIAATKAGIGTRNITPMDDKQYDIGASGKKFKNVWADKVYGAVFN